LGLLVRLGRIAFGMVRVDNIRNYSYINDNLKIVELFYLLIYFKLQIGFLAGDSGTIMRQKNARAHTHLYMYVKGEQAF
jgi:hypothetical protein